ncbi:hypothetical protein BGX27_011128 [Mortierella sp. AM989]|nr:hypothetical protein BGX27_011128 [Mortierella sp. AM989]
MNDISTSLMIVSSLVTTISSSISHVKLNKRICGKLARKCEWLNELLENGELGSPTNPALKQLIKVLEACDKDLKKFASSGILLRIISKGGIPEICDRHVEELDEWVNRIRDTASATISQNTAGLSEDEDEDEDGDKSEDKDEDEDEEEENRDAERYRLMVTRNREDAGKAFISRSVPRQLRDLVCVNPDSLKIERQQIGTFPFGIIYRGTYNEKAVYIRELHSDISGEALENIRAGIILAKCLSDCDNIVPIYGICGDRMIVTAMPANGPLSEYTGELTTLQKISIAIDIADALVFMHDIEAEAEGRRRRIIHRDIRAANILLTDTLKPMLTGFEMCKGDGDLTGTRPDVDESFKRWWPRERLRDCGTFPESDVYSFGILMYEISTGREPEEGADPVALERSTISAEYNALMRKCLEGRGNARPKIDKVMDELQNIRIRLEISANE